MATQQPTSNAKALIADDVQTIIAGLAALYNERVETANQMERAWGFNDHRTQQAWDNVRKAHDTTRSITAKLGA